MDAGDGIYSRDWPELGDTGRHYAWLRVKWEGADKTLHKYLGSFYSGGAVNLTNDAIPPNRITDLRARKIENDSILLNFTAPGNNGTWGIGSFLHFLAVILFSFFIFSPHGLFFLSAARYKIMFSNDVMDLTSEDFISPPNGAYHTELWPKATEAGEEETYILNKTDASAKSGFKYAAIQVRGPVGFPSNDQ